MIFVECLKGEYKEHGVVGKEYFTDGTWPYTYPNCTMPWQQSMLGKHWSSDYNQSDVITCNDTQLTSLYALDYDYLKLAARLNITKCPGTFLSNETHIIIA